jgi:replicative DNA helicase
MINKNTNKQNDDTKIKTFSEMTEKLMKNSTKSKINLRLPPQNTDAEVALLGSILVKPDSIYEILEFIVPESFYSKKHQIIFKSMYDLSSKSEPIDILTVSSDLKDKGELETIGGDNYLVDISTAVATASNIEHYGKIVYGKYTKRRLIKASEIISNIAYDQEKDVETSLDLAESSLSEISSSISSAEFIKIDSTIKEA